MADLIDTRDLRKRLEELEDELLTLTNAIEDAEEEDNEEENEALEDAQNELEEWQEENEEELKELRYLQNEVYEFNYGATLINDDYFPQYAEDLADDLYGVQSRDWPFCHIDWDAAADALKIDYISVEYQGEIYWVRV